MVWTVIGYYEDAGGTYADHVEAADPRAARAEVLHIVANQNDESYAWAEDNLNIIGVVEGKVNVL